jgi:hypothetical protein
MTSTARTALSSVTYIVLVPFLIASAILAGPLAGATAIAFSLLVAYGALGITVLSYSAPHYVKLNGVLKRVAVPNRPASAIGNLSA